MHYKPGVSSLRDQRRQVVDRRENNEKDWQITVYDALLISKRWIYTPSLHSCRSILLTYRLLPLYWSKIKCQKLWRIDKSTHLQVFAWNAKIVLRACSIHHLRSAQHLHKFLIVCDAYQLKVSLCWSCVQYTIHQKQSKLYPGIVQCILTLW